jgi:hypothetical protein
MAGLMRAISGYEGSFVVRRALLFFALTFQRPGEVCKAGVERNRPRGHALADSGWADENAAETYHSDNLGPLFIGSSENC